MPVVSPPPAVSPATPDEAALVALVGRIRFGDAEALGQLYDLTVGRVYALALRVLRQPQDAEEVVGDVFLQVWEQAVGYCPERGTVLPWLLTLAWSRAVDRRRRRGAQSREVHPEALGDAYRESEEDPASELLEHLANVQRLAPALAALSPAQRTVLMLAYHEDLSQPEIALRTGLPVGTVKSHARRGLAALRAALAGEGGEP
ncbi:hypothetical protein N790_03370 [Arenimonas malthae CC-JY-1]|uniref:HTH luxR-type domain-containing protein n=1 Tax=Arenimonas malthae CC-JY-1 TaxID=1384054 RepID=A0A091C668_9GAMM|nr:sigma-70 family RNA polymerase sigma factor [Arenimonas malthae]KFN52150.1 hypothetical protein N790_03370 [Arenimonas malthae CC-JY-1]